jgi:low temperature requirement protein LtrA
MTGRDPTEPHRASTPLELLFDLCFVVAVSQAAGQLHHGLASDDIPHAVTGFLTVFFAIWWAWLNFTWFASAYDTDDVPYRLLTFVQITGVLILATGVGDAFNGNFRVVTTGYVVMRISMTVQWLRAAVCDAARRRNALRYAGSLTVIQIGWVASLFAPADWRYVTWLLLVAAELAGPYWAEHTGEMTQWHPKHIAERYGLFTIIVFGECILSAFVAIDTARTAHGTSAHIAVLAGAGLVSMFGLWWMYFRLSAERMLEGRSRLVFVWGYGHYLLFASIAALGAGIATVAGLSDGGHGETADAHHRLSTTGQALVVAIPIAVTLLLLAMMRPLVNGGHRRVDLVAYASALLVALAGLLAGTIGLTASLCTAAAIVVASVAFDELIVGSADRG